VDLRGSRHSDSNRGPTVYKTVALPLCYAGEAIKGTSFNEIFLFNQARIK